MNRQEFLKTLGSGALLTCAGCLMHCGTDNNVTPTDVDFTIDISQAPYTALQNVGGSATKSSVIIARISATEFSALSKTCTHEGTAVEYQSANSRFHCPNHGSNFSLSGLVINGPATRSLQQFNVTLDGTQLRVFA